MHGAVGDELVAGAEAAVVHRREAHAGDPVGLGHVGDHAHVVSFELVGRLVQVRRDFVERRAKVGEHGVAAGHILGDSVLVSKTNDRRVCLRAHEA